MKRREREDGDTAPKNTRHGIGRKPGGHKQVTVQAGRRIAGKESGQETAQYHEIKRHRKESRHPDPKPAIT